MADFLLGEVGVIGSGGGVLFYTVDVAGDELALLWRF